MRWNYDLYRGRLASEDYPDATTGNPPTQEGTGGPTYAYKPSGRLETRVWKRGVTTTYAYNNAGDLESVSYTGGVSTPTATYPYDQRGKRWTAVRNGITTSFTYNDANLPLTESHSGGTLSELSMNHKLDLRQTITVLSQYGAQQTDSGELFVPPARGPYSHDADGNVEPVR